MDLSASSSSQPAEPMVRPVVVVSQCLGFAAVRYNGQMLQDSFVQSLANHVQFKEVCPEVGIGLGVPRDPIRIVVDESGRRLIQPTTGRDLTDLMHRFGSTFLSGLQAVDGFILKSRSPSCGIKDVKVFSPDSQPLPKSSGLFAEAVQASFPEAVIEDEGRLTNFRIRHHFLTRLFAAARLRRIRGRQAMADLVRFHTEYKLQLMAFGQRGLQALGRIVANAAGLDGPEVFRAYAAEFARACALPAKIGSTCNVLQHAFGYVTKDLTAQERSYFLDLLEDYRQARLPLSALLTVLNSWIVRFEQEYLAAQRFFNPYPRAFMELTDSAAGKIAER
jgi:uncharacterized protein YbgA (DUF1722 family)/uncharacterized protein YbbK (DUF523 family)